MSSPLGGFYIGAINRAKASSEIEKKRVRLIADIMVSFQQKVVFSEQLKLADGVAWQTKNEALQLHLSPKILDSGLCQLSCRIEAKGEYRGGKFDGEQLFNLELGEQVTSLVGGNEHLKVKVVCSRG